MSRGPGSMMRAALAELDRYGQTQPWSVARLAMHDKRCNCGEMQDCRRWEPTRSDLVSARRALHRLYGQGLVTLARVSRDLLTSGWNVHAVKCCPRCKSAVGATLTSQYGGTVCYRTVLRAVEQARKCCGTPTVDGAP